MNKPMKVNTEKFDSLISEKESKWHHYEANSIWRKKATEISLQILSHLRLTFISQTKGLAHGSPLPY